LTHRVSNGAVLTLLAVVEAVLLSTAKAMMVGKAVKLS
jgi:hypothetical protein